MDKHFYRCEIANGVNFSAIEDKRFKTGKISINMFLPLDKEKSSAFAVLPFALSHSCRKYPDFTSLNKYLSELYGASVYSNVSKIGDAQALTISASFLDDRYALEKECLSKKLTQLICDMIFDPLFVNGKFDGNNVEQGKRQIVELIDSEYNDKRILAKLRCEQLMFKNERCGINRFGERSNVLKLTPDVLFDAWKYILNHAKIEIMMISSADYLPVINVFKDAFSKINRDKVAVCDTHIIKNVELVNEQRDEMNVAQSKLVMGFRTGVALQDEKVMAMRVAVSLFGATPMSKLFLNVREKLSLCYYCSANYDRNKGVMLVQSGVEKDNIDKARNEILNQLEDVKKGNFTQEDLDNVKRSLFNSYNTIGDLLSGLESFYLSQVFDERFLTPEDFIESLNLIKFEQVVDAAKMINLDTVYVLVGNGEVSE